MKKYNLPGFRLGIFLVLSLSALHRLYASDSEVGVPSEKDWEVRIGLPLWATGVEGTVGVLRREAKVDESFTDIVDNLDFVAPLNIEVRTGRWELFANGLYSKTTVHGEPRGLLAGIVTGVEVEQVNTTGNIGLGYEVVRTAPFRLEVFGGARLNFLDVELSVNLPSGQRTFDRSRFWADPIVGLQGQYQFTDHFALYAKGDVGGFGVSSDFTSQAEGGMDFGLSEHTYLRLSYRFLSVDFEDDGFRYDMKTSGPQLEFGFRF